MTVTVNIIKALSVFLLVLMLSGCGQFCLLGFCFTNDLTVHERDYDQQKMEFTILGKTGGKDVFHAYKISDKKTIKELSFGMSEADTFAHYGVLKKIDVLNNTALETYRKEYLIPGKDCPAWFMNKNLETLLLIGATQYISEDLKELDIPFDGRGTEFELSGHYLDHINDRYRENGNSINLQIAEHISISSNVGSAKRKVHYFLVTEIL